MKNTINVDTCRKCGACAEVCPSDIIVKYNGGHYFFPEELKCFCVSCGQCMAICPTNSIQVNDYKYGETILPLSSEIPDYKGFINLLKHRRSVRNFVEKTVPNEIIQQIIDSLAYMPYGFLPDAFEITVVNEKLILDKSLPLFSAFYEKMKKWMHHPFTRYMIKKSTHPAVFSTIKDHLLPLIEAKHYKISDGDDNILRKAPCLIIFHSGLEMPEHLEDCWIATTIASLTAVSLGLGTTIIGLVPPALNKSPELKQLFNIPEKNEVISALIVGYPKLNYRNSIARRKSNVSWISS